MTPIEFQWIPLTSAHEVRLDFRELLLGAERAEPLPSPLEADDRPLDGLWCHPPIETSSGGSGFGPLAGAVAIARSAIEEALRELGSNDALAPRLRHLAEGGTLRAARHGIVAVDDRVRACLGWIGAWRETAELIERVARLASETLPVLVLGESGAGKELVARGLHRLGRRRERPYCAINCAELPESILESELFGHTRGSFTGAATDRPGLFEAAGDGTVFLDEIGELPLAAQAKLLRVLEEHRVRRIGAVQARPLGCRIVAATNRDLAREITRGRFRADLYYRLRGSELRLKPLRERRQDIVPLASSFARRAALRFGRAVLELSADARLALLTHDWPGNIRELRQAVDVAVLGASGGIVDAAALSLVPQSFDVVPVAEPLVSVSALERAHILRALATTDGNKMAAARILGLTRQSLQRRITRHGIVVPSAGGRPVPDGGRTSGHDAAGDAANFGLDPCDPRLLDRGTPRARLREPWSD